MTARGSCPLFVEDRSQRIKWALHAHPTLPNNVGIDHCGLNVLVTEQLLYRPDVIVGLQQLCGKAMSERVRADRL